MAIFKAGSAAGVKMGGTINFLSTWDHSNQSADHFTLTLKHDFGAFDIDWRAEFSGHFSYRPNGSIISPGQEPDSGTVTSWTFFSEGRELYAVTAIHVPVVTFYADLPGIDDGSKDWGQIFRGNDRLYGGHHPDSLVGFRGNDTIHGGAGNDVLSGGDGNDTIHGGSGRDTLYGGAGNDVFHVDRHDTVTDTGGLDTVRAATSFALGGTGYEAIERLWTASATATKAIHLTGNEISNNIVGNAGSNRLNGLGGNDKIRGLNGNDVLNGGEGSDVLTGGAGRDTFRFTTALSAANIDRIVDFRAGDRIALDDRVFAGLSAGALSTQSFEATAQDADDRILYDSATGMLRYDADGTGAGAAIAFARLSAGLSLTAADFLVT